MYLRRGSLGILSRKLSSDGLHVQGNLQMHFGWEWSNSPGNASGEAWSFNFSNGERYSSPLGNTTNKRTLCVRRSGD
jgi:hypothetical protein